MTQSIARTLMHHKSWATGGLHAVLEKTMDALPDDDRFVVLLLLDHLQAVDEIFRHNLKGRPHGYDAPRSAELPSLDAILVNSRSTAAWYDDYADELTPDALEDVVEFSFANGEPARMTRAEMLLHLALHAAGHRGQVAFLLQKNGIPPFPDRITDYLSTTDTGSEPAEAAS